MIREEALKKLKNNIGSILELECFINKIYDDFENKTCSNCKYINKYNKETWECSKDIKTSYFTNYIEHNFCCNKWESK